MAPLLSLGLAPLILLASPGVASAYDHIQCKQTTDGSPIPGTGAAPRSTFTVTQQASNTWQDWVWRGGPKLTFRCSWEVPQCTYAWTKTKSTSWSLEVGLKLPDIKGFGLSPTGQRTMSTTTSYTWTIYMKPGQFAEPIQVVDRRWRSGDVHGAWVSDHRACGVSAEEYYWDPNYYVGQWSDNIAADGGYGTYNVWS
ncbi:hypothetical protein RKE30_38145 [Streptomyces sp. Li-HN-5-11]|uniref:hypothetical protein n=1 Tax=Streptomyces sp. Li-HN-5-11 TaxID=3075432 RepID=UPI0028A833B6|nr:hypothetical protein [Streptomyces sp. Li-HN-5-11]WNM35771.1 hypothetical protein RKE30_38145 [Streptomyces sp. Li-HN-5-11]